MFLCVERSIQDDLRPQAGFLSFIWAGRVCKRRLWSSCLTLREASTAVMWLGVLLILHQSQASWPTQAMETSPEGQRYQVKDTVTWDRDKQARKLLNTADQGTIWHEVLIDYSYQQRPRGSTYTTKEQSATQDADMDRHDTDMIYIVLHTFPFILQTNCIIGRINGIYRFVMIPLFSDMLIQHDVHSFQTYTWIISPLSTAVFL